MGGGGNWEFEAYTNNRSVSFARNGSLNIFPRLMADTIGDANVKNGFDMDIWGGDPASLCTGNMWYGCERTSGAGGNYLNPIASAKLRTAETFAFTYGRVEVVAKLPKGDWMWPAIWMLPVNQGYGNWPVSGEIDIMESRGNARGYPAGGVESFGSTLHYGPWEGADAWNSSHAAYTVPSGDLSDAFHTYGMFWNSTTLFTYIDAPANVVLSVDLSTPSWARGGWADSTGAGSINPWADATPAAPFDSRYYLILEVAVGGTGGYFPDNSGGKPWSDTSPHAANEFYDALSTWYPCWPQTGGAGAGTPFQIDSVKVWQAGPDAMPGADFAFRPML